MIVWPLALAGTALTGTLALLLAGGNDNGEEEIETEEDIEVEEVLPADPDLAAAAEAAPGAIIVADNDTGEVTAHDPAEQPEPLPTDDENEDAAAAAELEADAEAEPDESIDVEQATAELLEHGGDEDEELTEEIEEEEAGGQPADSPQTPSEAAGLPEPQPAPEPAPIPQPVPVIPEPQPQPQPQPEPSDDAEEVIDPDAAPEVDPQALMLANLLLRAEKRSGWKGAHQDAVKDYQKARDLKPDGKFGPGTALALAGETGKVPLIRYMPSGSWPGSHHLTDYKQAIEALGLDASREAGQSFQSNPPAQQA